MIGLYVGILGLIFGFFVAPAQLFRIIKTKEVKGISLTTYIFLCCAMTCYLLHAISINSPVFVTAQSVNLLTNLIILVLLIRRR
jgi:uncharacterized protein with PQ loop repeat